MTQGCALDDGAPRQQHSHAPAGRVTEGEAEVIKRSEVSSPNASRASRRRCAGTPPGQAAMQASMQASNALASPANSARGFLEPGQVAGDAAHETILSAPSTRRCNVLQL